MVFIDSIVADHNFTSSEGANHGSGPMTESARLASLLGYEVLDSLPEVQFDELTKLAAEICEAPISLISFVDKDRQWFKSRVGISLTETPRAEAFCSEAVNGVGLMEVPDALEDERFASVPLVAGVEQIRFYAGVSLVAPNGAAVGTICVMDRSPRKLTASQRESLVALGRQVVERLELRKRIRRLKAEYRAHNGILVDGEIVAIASDLSGGISYFNRGAEELLGYGSGEMMGRTLASLRAVPELALGGEGGSGEETYLCKDGSSVRVKVVSRVMKDALGGVIGTFTVMEKVKVKSGEMEAMGDVLVKRRLERALIGLGVVAVLLIAVVFMIARQLQKEHHQTQVAFKDATLEFALSHLWLEQMIAGDEDHEFARDVHGKLDAAGDLLQKSEVSEMAARLSRLSAMDQGNHVEAGKRLKKMAWQLEEWRKLAVERWSDPAKHRAGSALMRRCDELFEEIMGDGRSYGEFLRKVEAGTDDLIRTTFLLLGAILVAMMGIAGLIFRRARLIEEKLRAGLMIDLEISDEALAKEATESRMGREELAVREKQMTEFFNRSNDLILAVGEDGRIVFANRAWQVVMGYSREESLGLNLFDSLVLETREDGLKSFQTIFRGEVVGVAEISILTKGGEKIELLGNLQLEGVGEGKRVWGIFRNETELRSVTRSQEKYLEQKARFNEALLMVRDQLEGEEFDCDALAARTISDMLGADRVSLWQFRDEPRAIDCQGLFQRSEGRFELVEMSLLESAYPRYFAAVSGYRPVLAEDARRDPMTSEFTDGYLIPLGIFSMLDVPLRLGDALVGVLCCEQLGGIRQWTGDEVKFVTDVVSYLMLAKERILREKAELELARHKERNRLLVEGSQVALVSIDEATRRFTFGNPAALELFGVSEVREFLEMGLAEISAGRQADGEDSRAGAEAMIRTAFEIGTFSGDWIFRRGAWSIFIGTITLTRLEQDGQPFLHGVVRDISAQKLAEQTQAERAAELERLVNERTEALRKSQKQFEDLFEFAPDAVILVNAEQKINLFNQNAVELFQYAKAEVVGELVSRLFDGDSKAKFLDLLGERLEDVGEGSGEMKSMRMFGQKKDGEKFPMELTLSPLASGVGLLWMVAVRDISERLRVERKAQRAQRLESIGQLAGGVAHDINNALAPILMASELLRLELPQSVELVETIESSTKRCAMMVKQLLAFARGSEGEQVPIRPFHLLKELEGIMASTFPKNIIVRHQYSPELATVRGDSTQLHQVLLNLCVNARDAMPNGGTLTVQAEIVDLDAAALHHLERGVPGRYIRFRVTDNGAGIEPEHVERIFDPFFTTKSLDQGTGLGLSTVLGIVKNHGGWVQVYSAVGEGSVFSVYLPSVVDAVVVAGMGGAKAAPFKGDGELVLVVDDEVSVRRITEALLVSLNFRVVTASSGVEALALIAEHRKDLRFILTDLHMPQMDGIGLLREVRVLLPGVEVIVASGRMDEEQLREIRRLGVKSCLDKPFTRAGLIEALRVALGTSG